MSGYSTKEGTTRAFPPHPRPQRPKFPERHKLPIPSIPPAPPCPPAERPPFPMSGSEKEVESLETPKNTKRVQLEKLLKRVSHLRLISRFDANPGGFSCGDWQAIRLHKVQAKWYETLDMAFAMAESALQGMIETETQYRGESDD